MGKPRMIILIRHAQSEGNKNREIHQTVPDHRVQLTTEGWSQAREAGRKLRSLLHPADNLHFFTSPYRRTRETTEGILDTLTSSDPEISPFPRHKIKVYEEPRLREQDFGNFQPNAAEMARMWKDRAEYGHFFYRIPNGESAADAYDRVSGFNESLWRSFSEDNFASVCVLVTHGLMTRVFLMKWYHFSVEYFEDLRNVNHCEFVVMKLNPQSGKYVLQNQLRTWSGLKRERQNSRAAALEPESPVPIRKKWNGCQDANDSTLEDVLPQRRQNTADLFMDEQLEARINEAMRRNGAGSANHGETPSASSSSSPRSHRDPKMSPFTLGPSSANDTLTDSNNMQGLLPPGRSSMSMALRGDFIDVDSDADERPRADALGDQSDIDDGDDNDEEKEKKERLRKAELTVDGSVR